MMVGNMICKIFKWYVKDRLNGKKILILESEYWDALEDQMKEDEWWFVYWEKKMNGLVVLIEYILLVVLFIALYCVL